MKKTVLLILLLAIIFTILLVNKISYVSNQENVNSESNSNIELYEIKYFNPIHPDYNYGDDFTFYNSIYYKIINNYQEYLTYKKYYPEIIDMLENDFNNNFMILTITENESTKNLEFQSIDSDDTTLYIGLNKSINDIQRGISIKIDNSLLREKIDTYKSIENIDFMSNYKDLKNISRNYTTQEAISDNCFVISSTGITSNEQIFDTFIDNINNYTDSEIRIVYQTSMFEYITIFDIKYCSQKNKYYVCRDTSRNVDYKESYNYFEYDKFEKNDLNKLDLINSKRIENYMFYNNDFPETNFSISFYTNK